MTAGSQAKRALAIRLGGSGNLTDSPSIVWRYNKGTAYVPSPILYGDYLYLMTDTGLLTCLDAVTGERKYEGGRVPVDLEVNGKVYSAGVRATRSQPVVYIAADLRGPTGESVTLAAGETKRDIRLEWAGNLGTFADDPFMLMRDIAAMAKVSNAPTPQMPDGKPDFSGIWDIEHNKPCPPGGCCSRPAAAEW